MKGNYKIIRPDDPGGPKAVSKLMGHAEEIITIDVYGDNQEIITDCTAEIAEFVADVTPDTQREDLLNIVVDVSAYIPDSNVS